METIEFQSPINTENILLIHLTQILTLASLEVENSPVDVKPRYFLHQVPRQASHGLKSGKAALCKDPIVDDEPCLIVGLFSVL